MLQLVTPQAQVKKTSIQQMWSNDLDRLEQAIRILGSIIPHVFPVFHDLNHLELQIQIPVFDQCVGDMPFIAGEMYGNEEREISSGSKKRKANSGDVVAVTLPALCSSDSKLAIIISCKESTVPSMNERVA